MPLATWLAVLAVAGVLADVSDEPAGTPTVLELTDESLDGAVAGSRAFWMC